MVQAMWIIHAGMVLGVADEKFNKAFSFVRSGDEKRDAERFLEMHKEATEYMDGLVKASASGMEPNWVKLDYIWV